MAPTIVPGLRAWQSRWLVTTSYIAMALVLSPLLTAGRTGSVVLVIGAAGSLCCGLICYLAGIEAGQRDRVQRAAVAARKRQAERAARDERRARIDAVYASLPGADKDGGGYLYVILFETGSIKVGRTGDPRCRLRQHRRHARAYGVQILDAWVSVPHRGVVETESALIGRCCRIGIRARSEYFRNIEFDTAVRIADEIAQRALDGSR